jgi:ATP-dependent RNA helicase RhlE
MLQSTFHDLGVSPPVVEALAARDLHVAFQIQQMVMEDALAGRDVLAKSKTGSGKTLAFAVPIVERLGHETKKPAALVLVPTRELCVQVTEEFTIVAGARNLGVASAYGGVPIPQQAKRIERAHIIVATPGRIEDLAQRRLVSLAHIRILVLDEADRMLDMGFQPQVNAIVRRLPKERQTMFFSATLDGDVGRLAKSYTNDATRHEIEAPRQTAELIHHRFVQVNATNKVAKLAEVLEQKSDGLALVFVRTKRGADRLIRRLANRNIDALAMHGDMPQMARQRALRQFESGKIDVLVATDVAARGLDLDDITYVINFDPPDDDKSYVHRVE